MKIKIKLHMTIYAVCFFVIFLCSCKTTPKNVKPAGKKHSLWTGWWQSKVDTSSSGRLVMRLPHPLPKDKEFIAGVYIYYRRYGMDKRSGSRLVKARGFFRLSKKGETDETKSGKVPFIIRLSGIERRNRHVVRFKAYANDSISEFHGRFRWQNPFDTGSIFLKREGVFDD
ncbi:hypothetical protein ACFL20_12315 [Spirochaetota bacterium]